MQISCPWNILSQLWSPEAAHGYRGRDSERGMGEKQSRKEGVHSERGCIGCLNSSKSWGSAVCVCVWCHVLGAVSVGVEGQRTADEGVEVYKLVKYVCICALDSESQK